MWWSTTPIQRPCQWQAVEPWLLRVKSFWCSANVIFSQWPDKNKECVQVKFFHVCKIHQNHGNIVKSVLRPTGVNNIVKSRHCDSTISKSSTLRRSYKDGWALHWPDKESTSNPKNDQPGIPSSDYPPGTKLPHAGKSPSPGNVHHAFKKKTHNMKLLTVHHTESSCCQVKFGFSLLRTEIFGSCPNVSLLSATPPMSQFQLEGITTMFRYASRQLSTNLLPN